MTIRSIRPFIYTAAMVLILFSFATPALAHTWTWGSALVPCGIGGVECTQCELFHLAEHLIDFVVIGLVPVVGGLMFTIAGFYILTAGATPANFEKGKSIFTNTFYAIIVISAAWLITNTIIVNLGKNTLNSGGNWYEITCANPTTSGPPPGTGPGTPPGPVPPTGPVSPPTSGTNTTGKSQAQAILAAGIPLSTIADCSGFNASTTVNAIAQGNFPPVCSPSCDCKPGGTSGTVTVNPAILDGLNALKTSGSNFTITSLTTGKHSASSAHYTGRAADIQVNGSPDDYFRARDFLLQRGGTAFCETAGGTKDETCGSSTDHIHWQI